MKHEKYQFYGVEASYYAAKTRSQLLRKGIPFEEIQCDRRAFAEVIVPRVGYPVVPIIVTTDDEVLQDTAEIFDALEARYPDTPLIPATPVRRFAAYLMELLADEWLKLPALHYRWYYDYEFAHLMMGRNNDPDATDAEQRRVGARIASEFKSWPEHLGATEATREAVEASFLDCLDLLDAHFRNHDFALGPTPSLADCAMMGPLYAHLYRDPHSGTIVKARAPALCEWIDRMRDPAPTPEFDWSEPDSVPESMTAVLRHLTSDFVPVMATAMPLLQAWLGNRDDEVIPRYVGKHRFTVGRGHAYAADGMRSIHPFEQWKVQRLMAVMQSIPASARHDVDEYCDRVGAGELTTLEFPNRLARAGFRLVRAN